MTALIDALGAHKGIVCAIGAGGKKSVLYQLAREHPGRFALTATVHNTVFPEDLPVETVIEEDAALHERVLAVDSSRSVAYACPSTKPGRHAGASPETIRSLHETGHFDATLVKADGARMRWRASLRCWPARISSFLWYRREPSESRSVSAWRIGPSGLRKSLAWRRGKP